jgi:hypothetical protein
MQTKWSQLTKQLKRVQFIPITAQDFEREIDECTASDNFAVDVADAIATAETKPQRRTYLSVPF